MARKKKHEEHENHERWLVSYADFITLLFAFFVVMYAISSVNEGKYRVLSDALVAAFRAPPKSLEPIQMGTPLKAPMKLSRDPKLIEPIKLPIQGTTTPQIQVKAHDPVDKKNMDKMASKIESALAGLIAEDVIKVRRTEQWIEVEINTKILFPSGSSLLQPAAVPVLDQLGKILKDFPNIVRVEGFTDNVPISTSVFPSNWELSAARSASVVHLFADVGVDPHRLAAIGYGEFKPVASNKTPEGRARNRRVLIVILSIEAGKTYDRNVSNIEPIPLPETNINLDVPDQPLKPLGVDGQPLTPQVDNKPLQSIMDTIQYPADVRGAEEGKEK